jgi:hypothetical protein
MPAVIFCLLKNYHPMQKMMSVVIDIHKFDQEFYIIGMFWKFLYKYLKIFPIKASKNIVCSLQKQNPDENFLQHAKI